MTRVQVTWVLGTIVATISIIGGAIALWPSVGWTTPNQSADMRIQHALDVAQIKQEQLLISGEILDAITESRDEWKCDEYDEELLDKLKEQVDSNSVELQREIEKLKKKIEKLDCVKRFEDFG